jgi:heme/copper-type cytochrome/quinol oxidase subunit 4
MALYKKKQNKGANVYTFVFMAIIAFIVLSISLLLKFIL